MSYFNLAAFMADTSIVFAIALAVGVLGTIILERFRT
jgi:hypothetical protein